MKIVTVDDDIQQGYSYELVAPVGADFDPAFKPQLTPKQMLELGVFGGSYLNDCQAEFPKDWFTKAKLSDHGPDAARNFFKISASQPLAVHLAQPWLALVGLPRGAVAQWFGHDAGAGCARGVCVFHRRRGCARGQQSHTTQTVVDAPAARYPHDLCAGG